MTIYEFLDYPITITNDRKGDGGIPAAILGCGRH